MLPVGDNIGEGEKAISVLMPRLQLTCTIHIYICIYIFEKEVKII